MSTHCSCHGCGVKLKADATDVLCPTCLDAVRAELASLLRLSHWRTAGFAYGKSLEEIIRRLPMPKSDKSIKIKLPGEYRVPASPGSGPTPIYRTEDYIPAVTGLPSPSAAPPADPATEGAKHAPKQAS
jgi:hypothetical protein